MGAVICFRQVVQADPGQPSLASRRASQLHQAGDALAVGHLAGPAAGLTRLASVRLDDLAQTGNCAHIPFQWEAIAADGKLFTTLDADLMLVPAGDQLTALALAGAYRPQPGPAGAGLDRAIVRYGATTAIGSFLTQVACVLVHPAGTGESARARRAGES